MGSILAGSDERSKQQVPMAGNPPDPGSLPHKPTLEEKCMQFLIGLILGCAIAVGMMSSEESRLKLLQGMTHLINKVEQLAADSGLQKIRPQPVW